jgi:hypothetical protein
MDKSRLFLFGFSWVAMVVVIIRERYAREDNAAR